MANDGTVKIGTELDDSGFKSGLSKLGSVASGALKGTVAAVGTVATAASGAVAGLLALEEATEEYRVAQGKLNTAFEAAGYDIDTAQQAYSGFYRILGDTDTATEASQLLAKLAQNAEDVGEWTRIAAGVNGTFGDSLPIEGLIEASNETAKVGTVTGVLADALNWAGISEDEFNDKLSACSDESERNQLIMNTLSGTYDDAADAFYRNNEALIQARDNQFLLDETMSTLGDTVAKVKNNLLSDFLPAIYQVTTGLSGMLSGTEGAEQQFSSGISTLIDAAVAKLPEFLDLGLQIVSNVAAGIASNIPEILSAAQEMSLAVVDGIGNFYPSISPITGAISLLIKNFESLLPIIVSVTAATKAYSAAVAISKVIEAVTKATQGMTIAQAALNAVMAINPFVLIATAIAALVAAIITLWTTNEGFRNAVISAWESVSGAFSSAFSAISSGVQSIIEWFANLPASISGAISSAISTLSGWAASLQENLVLAAETAINAVIEFFSSLPENIGYALGYAIGSVVKFGQSFLSWATNDLPQIINSVVDWFASLPGRIGEWLSETLSKIIEWGSNVLNSMKTAVGNAINAAIEWFKQLPSKIQTALQNALSAVKTWGENLISSAVEIASNTVNKIVEWFSTLPDRMLEIGKNIIQGLWDGISSMGDWIGDKISGFLDGFVNGAKDALGIHSPSTVMRDKVGKNIGLGVAEGITDSIPAALSAAQKLAKSIPAVTMGVQYTNASMAPVSASTPRFGTENALTQAAAMMAMSNTSNSREIVLTLNGREMARGLIDNIRTVEKQTPAIQFN